MPDPGWMIAKLGKRHDIAAFSSGVDSLDEYLKRFAAQNEKNGVSQHFVAVVPTERVVGYYALSAGNVAFDVVADDMKKRLPRYPIPVAHIGRLAVDETMQGQGLGGGLLMDAFARILRIADQIGIVAIEVIAINDVAKQFYQQYGFDSLLDDDRHLYISLKKIRKLALP